MDTVVKKPRISVIMAAYNAEKYIREAVESILKQTLEDWQLFIVNDCSTDKTAEILQTFTDPRIRVIHNEKNKGSVASRNIAFAESAGSEYIAILDADDVALPARLKKQVNFLDSHPDYGLVGSWTEVIDENGKKLHIGRDTTPPDKVPIKLLFHNFLAFSSIMMRRQALPEPFLSETSIPVEDVDLYWRMIDQWKFATLPEVLIKYRSHDKGISKVYSEKKEKVMDELVRAALSKIGIRPTEEELKTHRANFGYGGADTDTFLKKRREWLQRLVAANETSGKYDPRLFEEVVAEKWLGNCDSNARFGMKTWKIFKHSPLSKKITWSSHFKKLLKLWLKCFLRKNSFRA